MDELDIDLVEVTAHAGARPSHQEWQGQIYCRKGSHPKYKNFEEATGYGTGDGLCGWNCNHSFFPYVEGAPRTYSKAQLKDYSAKNIRVSAAGVKYELVSNDNIGRVDFAVPGEFSVYNSMGAAVCLVEMGYDFREVLDALSQCGGVPGRMELVKTDTPYSVIIDYAHTPDGLENVLTSVHEITDGRVICVFGCGGDRDKTKRPIMGEIGSRLADIAVITSDNPRSEDPQAIIDDIMVGVVKHGAKIIVEPDRTKAIAKALSAAKAGDVIVLAGKGHETYQILASGKIHYDEREIVAKILSEKTGG